MKTKTLNQHDIFQPGEEFHFTRTVLSRDPIRMLHDHDFFEVLWLQHGRAKHVINGSKQILTEGDLLFIRPSDCHAIQGVGEETHVVNIVFPIRTVESIAKRHGITGRLFWAGSDMPNKVHRSIRQLADLSRRAMVLEAAPRTLLSVEAFLIPLLADLTSDATDLPDNIPDWLRKACMAAQEAEIYREGSAGLVRAAGRTHAHVSRSMKKLVGETPSQYVNNIRMGNAARALTGTSDALSDIAQSCGITNLSHFHSLFRDVYRMTPNQFRKRFQKNVIQPI